VLKNHCKGLQKTTKTCYLALFKTKNHKKVLHNIFFPLHRLPKSSTFAAVLKKTETQSFLYLKKIKQTNTVEK